jgi:hypothetical protein
MNNNSATAGVATATTEGEPAGREARARLNAYLQALGLADRAHRERISEAVWHEAASKQPQHPAKCPTELAMQTFHELAEQWLEKFLPAVERPAGKSFISLFAMDMFTEWPAVFLADSLPAGFPRDRLECEVRAPGLRLSSMVPEPFDLPLRDVNLPSALGELTRGLAPSLVAKAVLRMGSALYLFSGNRRVE